MSDPMVPTAILDAKDSLRRSPQRVEIDEIGLSLGKLVRLRRILYSHGPRNGTALLLPIDQGLEHGPRDFFANPESIDPAYEWRLASEGDYSGILVQIGVAKKYLRDYAGVVPVIVKLNGKTEIPSEDDPISPLHASVEEAVAVGADAVAYKLWIGSSRQHEDFVQFGQVRREAERLGMPLLTIAYPLGAAVELKGGRYSSYATEYAARVACELGADLIKVSMPERSDEIDLHHQPVPYRELLFEAEEALCRVVRAAARTPVLLSGGERLDDTVLLSRSELAARAGVTGYAYGRNIWQRSYAEALRTTRSLWKILADA